MACPSLSLSLSVALYSSVPVSTQGEDQSGAPWGRPHLLCRADFSTYLQAPPHPVQHSGCHSVPIVPLGLCNKEQSVPFSEYLLLPPLPVGEQLRVTESRAIERASYRPSVSHEFLGPVGRGPRGPSPPLAPVCNNTGCHVGFSVIGASLLFFYFY